MTYKPSPREKLGVPAPRDPITGELKRQPSREAEEERQELLDRTAMEIHGAIERTSRVCSSESCRALIFFATTVSSAQGRGGKTIPLDASPVREGKRFEVRLSGGKLYAKFTQAPGEWGYVSHFATCPEAGKHRRRS